jgi:flagellar protein FlaG
MASNWETVTAVLARTLAPSSPAAASAPPSVSEQSGKNLAGAGQRLPAEVASPSTIDLQGIVRRLNEFMAERHRNLSFHIDEPSGRTVITVRDSTTHQVVRQIPNEEVLSFAHALEQAGVLVDAMI